VELAIQEALTPKQHKKNLPAGTLTLALALYAASVAPRLNSQSPFHSTSS
jgi:hypothetical protein